MRLKQFAQASTCVEQSYSLALHCSSGVRVEGIYEALSWVKVEDRFSFVTFVVLPVNYSLVYDWMSLGLIVVLV